MQYLMPTEMMSRLFDMWSVYYHVAWPFLLGHAFIVLTIWFGPLKEIRREIGALRSWRDTDEGTTECTKVLHEFVEETRQWGAQGTLVPMTDFTDRLDSQTSGLIDNLHSRINLFLVLGIAGTFFAMFQFAVNAVTKLPSGTFSPAQAQLAGQTIAQMLAQHLAMAFPVGFFGLIFTVIGHFIAFRKDSHLRSALTEASQHAMMFRRRNAKGPMTAIQDALKPLTNLHEALKHELQPVFEKLQEQLQSTADVLKQQVAPLAEAIGRFESAATALAAPAETLTRAAEKLPDALKRVEDIQLAERDHLTRLLDTEDKIRVAFERAAGSLQEATEGLAGLPSVLGNQFASELAAMREQAVKLWANASQEFFEKLSPVLHELNTASTGLSSAALVLSSLPKEVRAQIEVEIARLAEATSKLLLENGEKFWNSVRPLTETMQTTIEQLQSAAVCLSGTPEELVGTFRGQVTVLVNEALRTWKEQSGNFVNTIQSELQQRLELIRQDSTQASQSLVAAAKGMEEAASTISAVVRNAMQTQVENGMKELLPLLSRIEEAVAIQYPTALKNLREAAEHSGNLAKQANSATDSMKGILDGIESAEQQLGVARNEVEKAIGELRRAGMPAAPDMRPEIDRVHAAIGDLTDVVKRSSLWFRLFGSRQARATAGGGAPQ